jgi:hypothetical protein
MRYWLLLYLLFVLPARAEFQPFGLSMAYPASKLQGCTTTSDPRTSSLRCLTKDAPVKDQRFSEFQIGYTDAAGVCNFQATGIFDTKLNATALKESLYGLTDTVRRELGEPRTSFGDMQATYWSNPASYFQRGTPRPRTVASMSWEPGNEVTTTILRASLTATAIDEGKANLVLSVWFKNNWRCFRPEISPEAKVLKFNTLDLGFERLGQGLARLTQTEIAPEIYWIEVIDVRPSSDAQFGNGAMQSQQFFSLIGTCALWQAGRSLGRIFAFTPRKRFSGELFAFVPAGVSLREIESKTGGTLRELTQTETARSRELCEVLPSQLKADMANPAVQGMLRDRAVRRP